MRTGAISAVCIGVLLLSIMFLPLRREPKIVFFEFKPRSVRLDGEDRMLDEFSSFSFMATSRVHRLEYQMPDGASVRVELYPRAGDDDSASLFVTPEKVTGLPRHKVVRISPAAMPMRPESSRKQLSLSNLGEGDEIAPDEHDDPFDRGDTGKRAHPCLQHHSSRDFRPNVLEIVIMLHHNALSKTDELCF